MVSYEHIIKYAAEAGFDLCGVARARVLTEESERFEAGLAASGEEGLDYLRRGTARRFDPSMLASDARTVVVCALRYEGRYVDGDRGREAAYTRGGDYHPIIKGMLRGVLERLAAEKPGLKGKVCCDTSAILEKAWAVEAGLGWQGRNSLLVNPRYGSWLLLGELILDADSDRYDKPSSGVGCGDCRRCVEACPVGAIGENARGMRTLDSGRCISARTVERARFHPDTPIEPIHGWILGCDECQMACPYNKFEK